MPTSQIAKGKPILDLRKERLRPRTQDQIRAKIQVSQILNLLQDHVLNGTEIAYTRLSTGLALIKKVLPDAIHESIEHNNQAQAIHAIQQVQLIAMAQEMLKQNEKVVSNQSVIESIECVEPTVVSAYLQSDRETIPKEN